MKTSQSGLMGILLVIVSSLIFVLYFYSDIFLHPNTYLFDFNGDAVKNYFTYAAHIEDDALINSGILNYPYGENFLYLDSHPLLTMIIKALAIPFPGITNYSIGILNFLMIFGILITSVLLYLILRKLKVNMWYSAAGAVAISVLSPQIFRILGHYALSYSFMVPLTWYLFIRFTETNNRLKWSVYIFINNLLWYLIHGYMGMMAVSFIFICHLSYLLIYNQKTIQSWKPWRYFALQTVVPLFLFWLFITLSDTHIGRVKTPKGILENVANFYSVFLPHRQPLKHFFDQYFEIKTVWEGLSYIGVASSIVILFFILNNLLKVFKIKLVNDKPLFHNPAMITALISSVLLLFLSMGYPFKFKMEFLLEHIKVINNFRSIGRFAWVFYYVITVWAVYYMYLFYESRKNRKYLWIPFILLIPLSYFIEALPYHKETSVKTKVTPNSFSLESVPNEIIAGLKSFNAQDYQAIIPLPYFLMGAEDYGKAATREAYLTTMTFGYHTKLPLLANYSTNSSIVESKNLYQLLAPSTYQKEIENDINSDKPFLIVYTKEDLSQAEKNLLNRSHLVYENDQFSLLSLRKDHLFIDSSLNYISSFNEIQDQLVEKGGFLLRKRDKDKFLRFYSYDSLNSDITRTGLASYQGNMKDYNFLARLKPLELTEGKTYIFSFWMYNDNDQFGQKALDAFVIFEAKNSNNESKWLINVDPSKSVNIEGQWSLIEIECTIPDSNHEYSVVVKGKGKSKLNCYMDDLLIREKGCDVYKVLKADSQGVTKLFYNNHNITL